MSLCMNCGRTITDQPPRYRSGSDRFCSYLCIDVYAARHVATDSNCGVPGASCAPAPCGSERVMRMAKRVQLKRSKGWRMPPNTVKVDRTTRWGNPYKLTDYQFANPDGTPAPWNETTAREMSLRDFEHALRVGMLRVSVADVRRELRGKDLACWCKPGELCHADVLLEIAANG